MTNKKSMKRRPVAFNLDDPYQKKLYEYTMRFTNYSGHMKRLIQREMEGGNVTQPMTELDTQVDIEEVTQPYAQKDTRTVVKPDITFDVENHGDNTKEKPATPDKNDREFLQGLI